MKYLKGIISSLVFSRQNMLNLMLLLYKRITKNSSHQLDFLNRLYKASLLEYILKCSFYTYLFAVLSNWNWDETVVKW